MYVVVRVRGTANVRGDVEDTLARLGLEKPNHCVIIPETPDYQGMLQKAKDFIAYGSIDHETLSSLLRKRGRITGGKRLDEVNVKELGFKTVEEFAEALLEGKVRMKDFPNVKPVFRLRPPSRGYGSVKKYYPEGAIGNWGTEVNILIKKMV